MSAQQGVGYSGKQAGQQALPGKYRIMAISTMMITTQGHTDFYLMEPPTGDAAPTLILLAAGGRETLTTEPYCIVGRELSKRGWAAISLDLPCHGADSEPAHQNALSCWARRTAAGMNIVADFTSRVNDVIDHVIAAGIADPTRIAAAGTSRGGFMALHATAANSAIAKVAAFAPVTDLIALTEFDNQDGNPLVRKLALNRFAGVLSDRSIWIVIGSSDDRVGTDRAVGFARSVVREAEERGVAPQVTLHVTPTPGHATDAKWHDWAVEWLDAEWPRAADENPAGFHDLK